MTNVQFITLLSTAVGSFVLVILAWINQNQRLSDFREDTQRKFAEVNTRLDEFRTEANTRLHEFREEMHRDHTRIEGRLTLIETDQKEFFTVTGRLDGRIEQLSRVK